MIFHPNGGKLKQKDLLPWLRIWWWGRGTGLGWSRSFKRGAWANVEPAPGIVRTSISQVRAPCLPSSGLLLRHPEKNRHLYNRLPLLPEPELFRHICSFVRGTDGAKDVFLKYSVPCILHLTPQKPSTAVEPERHLVLLSDQAQETPHPHPTLKIKFRLPSWKAE